LLGEATAQNQRIRQLLNRISIVVKEYEAAQSNVLASLDNHYHLRRLPRELLEVFSHDPAAVTGQTRRLRGWRAVDDIHRRLGKQRAICRLFLSEHIDKTGGDIGIGSVLREPVNTLNSSLESLEEFKANVQIKAREIGELLMHVQNIHAQVKANYNSTLSHTSAVYPEVCHRYFRPDSPSNSLHSYSYLPLFVWKKVSRININSSGRLAWTRLLSSSTA
jgi:hypothetical protein